jgi:hypothetical protein
MRRIIISAVIIILIALLVAMLIVFLFPAQTSGATIQFAAVSPAATSMPAAGVQSGGWLDLAKNE